MRVSLKDDAAIVSPHTISCDGGVVPCGTWNFVQETVLFRTHRTRTGVFVATIRLVSGETENETPVWLSDF